mgnify:CR=1 FL=1
MENTQETAQVTEQVVEQAAPVTEATPQAEAPQENPFAGEGKWTLKGEYSSAGVQYNQPVNQFEEAPTETKVEETQVVAESAPTETLVPPVEDDSALACAISVTDNGSSVAVEFCEQVTRVRIGVDATGEWTDAEGNAATAELGEGRTFQYVALAGDTVLSEGSWNLDSADNVAEFSVTAADVENHDQPHKNLEE